MKKPFNLVKRIITIVLALALILCAVGCLDDEDFETEETATTSDETELNRQNIEEYFDTSIVREKQVQLKGDGTDKVTVLIYMNGSNLESDSEEATEDISEMIAAGTSDNVTCLIQTMGTRKWSEQYGIASNHSQRYRIAEDGLELVDDSLKQLDCTKASTLSDFIKWGVKNYPADRYILQFWDHGAGPVYGFGYDEWQSEDAMMSLDQMKKALSDGGAYFDIIGMDCCIMSCMETCLALYDYCDYMVLSEDFESGLGWSYEGWLKALNKNPSIDTVSLATIAIDDTVDENENDFFEGDSSCISLIDESMMKVLYTAWTDFAYTNEESLLNTNYSQKVKRSKRARPMKSSWGYGDEGFFSNFDSDAQLSDYYITDIMAVAQNIDSRESKALSAALSNTVLYNRVTSEDEHMTGLAVTLPYGDRDFYRSLKSVFADCGMDSSYISWLEKFVTCEGCGTFYDYNSDWDDWEGWEEYEDDFDWGEWLFSDDEEYWEDDDNWGWDDEYWCDEYGCYQDEYYDDSSCEYPDDFWYEY